MLHGVPRYDDGHGEDEDETAESYRHPRHSGQARLSRLDRGEADGSRGGAGGNPAHQADRDPPRAGRQALGQGEAHVPRLAGRERDDLLGRERPGTAVPRAVGQARAAVQVDGPAAGVVHVDDDGRLPAGRPARGDGGDGEAGRRGTALPDRQVDTDPDPGYLGDAEAAGGARLSRLLDPDDAVVLTPGRAAGTLIVIVSMADAPAARVTAGCCTLIQPVSSFLVAPAYPVNSPLAMLAASG